LEPLACDLAILQQPMPLPLVLALEPCSVTNYLGRIPRARPAPFLARTHEGAPHYIRRLHLSCHVILAYGLMVRLFCARPGAWGMVPRICVGVCVGGGVTARD